MITADTITDEQIRQVLRARVPLRRDMVHSIVRVALGASSAIMTQAEARARCAELLNGHAQQVTGRATRADQRQAIAIVRVAGVVQPPVKLADACSICGASFEALANPCSICGAPDGECCSTRSRAEISARGRHWDEFHHAGCGVRHATGPASPRTFDEMFATARETIARLEAERDARTEPMTTIDWSPAQHVRRAS